MPCSRTLASHPDRGLRHDPHAPSPNPAPCTAGRDRRPTKVPGALVASAIRPWLLVLLLAALALPAASPAAVFCARNGKELVEILQAAAINAQDDEVRVAIGETGPPGTYQYDFGPPIWSYRPTAADLDKNLAISGGWERPDCSAQVGRPEDTVLNALDKGAAFYFRAALDFSPGADLTLRGSISLRNLSITRARAEKDGSTGRADSAAIQYLGLVHNAAFAVERVIISDSSAKGASDSIVSVRVHGPGSFKLTGNVIADSDMWDHGTVAVVVVDCQGGALCYVNNNSIHDNLREFSSASPGTLALGGVVMAANNVVASNGTGNQAGPLGSEAGLDLRNNHFEQHNFSNPGYQTANTSGTAKWSRSGRYRIPDSNSSLRNTGRNNPFGSLSSLDIAGNPRVRENTVDRGAYETVNLAPALSAPSLALVSAHLAAGDVAYETSVTDPDGAASALQYSLVASSCTPALPADLFWIDAQGVVRLAAAVPAAADTCFVLARVGDGSLRTEASTTIRFNRAPKLADLQIALPGSTAVGAVVHTFAAQDDGVPNASLQYSLVAIQGPSSPFKLASDGKLSLLHPLPSQPGKYTLSVKACDTMPLCGSGKLVVNVGAGGGVQGALFRDGFE